MKRLLPFLLFGAVAFAQAPKTLPTDFVTAVAECACSSTGVPNAGGAVGYGHLITAGTGLYSYSGYELNFVRNTDGTKPKVLAQTNYRTGLALWIKDIGPIHIFGNGAAGVASTGNNTGGTFQAGGFAVLPLGKGGFGLVAGGWWNQSSIADPLNKTGSTYAFGVIYGFGKQ